MDEIPQEPGQFAYVAYYRALYPKAPEQRLLNWWADTKEIDDRARRAWAAVEAAIRADERERCVQLAFAGARDEPYGHARARAYLIADAISNRGLHDGG